MNPGALEGTCDPSPFTIKGTSRIQLLWTLCGESIQDHLVDPINRESFPAVFQEMRSQRDTALLVLETKRGGHRPTHAGGCLKLVGQGHTYPRDLPRGTVPC